MTKRVKLVPGDVTTTSESTVDLVGMTALQAENVALRERVAELEGALAPFAARWGKEGAPIEGMTVPSRYFRNAASVLAAALPPTDET